METVEELRDQVDRLKKTIKDMANEIQYLKDARTPEVAAIAQIVTERIEQQLPVKSPSDGRVALLRQHLRQELAYVTFLEESIKTAGFTVPDFNDLPKDKREAYFRLVDARIA